MLISYTGSSPRGVGNYTSKSVASQAALGHSSPSLKRDEMNGADARMSGTSSATNGAAFADDGLKRTAEAWECFTAGEDTVEGVRPEILTSWYRCREEYGVDPCLDRAPPAARMHRTRLRALDIKFF